MTVPLLLILSLVLNWTTIQTDYSNTFAHANLDEEVYMQLRKEFTMKKEDDYILCLNYSLYGL